MGDVSGEHPTENVSPDEVHYAYLRAWKASDGRSGTRLYLWCPGCSARASHAGLHAVEVDPAAPQPVWQWDGNLDAPTISPSIRVQGPPGDVCHGFVKAGRWEFLGDCTHHLAGQTVPLPALPDWIVQ